MSNEYWFYDLDLPDIIDDFDIKNERIDSLPMMSNDEILHKIIRKYGPNYKEIIDKRGNFYILLRARKYIYSHWLLKINKF